MTRSSGFDLPRAGRRLAATIFLVLSTATVAAPPAFAACVDLRSLATLTSDPGLVHNSTNVTIPAGTKVRFTIDNPNNRKIDIYLGNDLIYSGTDTGKVIVHTLTSTVTSASSIIVYAGSGMVIINVECISGPSSSGSGTEKDDVDDYVTDRVVRVTLDPRSPYGIPKPAVENPRGEASHIKLLRRILKEDKEAKRKAKRKLQAQARKVRGLKRALAAKREKIKSLGKRLDALRSRLGVLDYNLNWNRDNLDWLEYKVKISKEDHPLHPGAALDRSRLEDQIDKIRNDIRNMRRQRGAVKREVDKLDAELERLNGDPRLNELDKEEARRHELRQEFDRLCKQVKHDKDLLARNLSAESESSASHYVSPARPHPAFGALSYAHSGAHGGTPGAPDRIANAFDAAVRGIDGGRRTAAWFKATVSGASGANVSGARDYSGYNIASGFRTRLTPTIAAGAALRHERNDSRTIGSGTEIDTTLYGVALFADIDLPDRIDLTLTGAYEHAKNRVVRGGGSAVLASTSGEFDYRTLILAAGLSKRYQLTGAVAFIPRVGLNWSRTWQEGYTNSGGTKIASRRFDVGVTQFGAQLAKRWTGNANRPFLTALGIRTLTGTLDVAGHIFFKRPDRNDPSVTRTNPKEFSDLSATAGLQAALANGATASLSAGTFLGGRTSGQSWVFGGKAGIPLGDYFATGANLSVGGSFTVLPDDRNYWTTSARVAIPLQ